MADVHCPSCRKPLGLNDHPPEEWIRCPKCGVIFVPAAVLWRYRILRMLRNRLHPILAHVWAFLRQGAEATLPVPVQALGLPFWSHPRSKSPSKRANGAAAPGSPRDVKAR